MADLLEIANGAADKVRISPVSTTARKLTIADPGNNTSYLLPTSDSSGTVLDATAAELNRAADISARVVNVTTGATALSMTVTQHAEKIVVSAAQNATGCTFTLPTATGSGAKFTIINNVAQTQGTLIIACTGTDVMTGVVRCFDTTAVATASTCFVTSATSDKYSMVPDGTQGGEKGDIFECIDIAANTYWVTGSVSCTGAKATGFAAT